MSDQRKRSINEIIDDLQRINEEFREKVLATSPRVSAGFPTSAATAFHSPAAGRLFPPGTSLPLVQS